VATAGKRSVEARIDGDAISVNGARTASDELAAALGQAELLSIQLAPGTLKNPQMAS
jgi:hypothetical protein